MKTSYPGIDYGLGQGNINHDTGIRYGVIHHGEIGQIWYDESEGFYLYHCPFCEFEIGSDLDDICPSCEKEIEHEAFDCLEPASHFYIGDGYEAEQGHDDPDIFVTMSPYFTYAQFCSPCAPGAVYLMNPFINQWENTGTEQSGINSASDYPEDYKVKAEQAGFQKGYCFGHSWFESGKAPYPVYSVETGKFVKPD